jgi:peptide/nickel transport system substrate-binding protein
MFRASMPRGKSRFWLVGVVGALATAVVGCAPTSTTGSGKPVQGGTATVALPAGVTYNWIFPFTSSAYISEYNIQQLQWLMYRPLYMFGNNTGTSVTIDYPLSPAMAPVYSDGGRTITIRLKGWKWSDGEPVDANDVVFWLNMMEAEKTVWYGYVPGLIPDNLMSYRATSADTLTLHLNGPYSSLWYTYNQLAELTPMPAAWDVTKLGAKPGSGGCLTDSAADGWAKCNAVYSFLTAQSKQSSSYASSPIWSVVDGPWKLKSFNTDGDVTIVPNGAYSGSPKPRLSAVKFVPFTSDTAEYTALKVGDIDVGYVPPQDLPVKSATSALPSTNPLGSAYRLEPFYPDAIEYVQPNFDNPAAGYLFRQLYVRQALQYVMDQPGIDKAIFRGYAVPTSGAVPTNTISQWIPKIETENGGQGPYPFSISTAKALLTSHGWSQVGGVMTCGDPAKCGTGIKKGQQLKLTILYPTGQASISAMFAVYASDAAKAGIGISLVGQSFNTIIGESSPCAMGPKCTWQVAENGGWIFNGPGFEPTGEPLFETGDATNLGSYNNPAMNKLISETHTSDSLEVFHQYATYAAEQLPYIWNPDPYQIQAVSSNLHGVTFSPFYTMLPEYWYFTK